MYKRRKIVLLVGTVLLLALFCQGCNKPASSGNLNTESSKDVSETIPTETIDTEVATEEATEEVEEPTVMLPSEASPIGSIRIQSSWIGDEYVDAVVSIDGIEGFSQPISEMSAKIKVRGNTSKYLAKKSYNIKFDEKMSLFGLDSGKKWSLLATASDKSMLRTPIAFLYAQAIEVQYASQFHMTELWINDEYRGVYVLIEPVQEGKNRVDIDLGKGDFLIECNITREEEGISYISTNQGMRFEINEPEEPTEEQKAAYVEWLNAAEAAVVSMDHNQYLNYIDIESFVNYYIFEEVTKNVDFGRFSTRYYCKDGKLYAGPPWDMDLALGNVSRVHWEPVYHEYNNNGGYGSGSNDSTDGRWADKQNWYKWLCQDEYFMNQVKLRWTELLPVSRNLFEENELGVSRIDYLLNGYREQILRNYQSKAEGGAGWSLEAEALGVELDYRYTDYTESVEHLREWLRKRIMWLDTQFNIANEK